jgi:hypothetical protein
MSRAKLVKTLRLGGLAVLGMSAVSIPVTIAIVLSATGTSDALTLGAIAPSRRHTTPAEAVAGLRWPGAALGKPRRGGGADQHVPGAGGLLQADDRGGRRPRQQQFAV